jgi:hypothetical protein
VITAIVKALSAHRLLRIGRHEPTLDEIYRRAVEEHGLGRAETVTEGAA